MTAGAHRDVGTASQILEGDILCVKYRSRANAHLAKLNFSFGLWGRTNILSEDHSNCCNISGKESSVHRTCRSPFKLLTNNN